MKEKYEIITGFINRALICFICIVAGIIAYPQSLFLRNLITIYGSLIIANLVITSIINKKTKKR